MAKKKGEARNQMTIDYYPEADRAIDSIVSKIGARGTRKSVLTKVFVWFSEQDELVQLGIMGFSHPVMRKAQADSLRSLADRIERGEITVKTTKPAKVPPSPAQSHE